LLFITIATFAAVKSILCICVFFYFFRILLVQAQHVAELVQRTQQLVSNVEQVGSH
jgi:hypothetical protein